jgi:hypothetical protein
MELSVFLLENFIWMAGGTLGVAGYLELFDYKLQPQRYF